MSEKLPKTWTMRDGRKIKIKDMETSHLMNTIAMLERTFPSFKLQQLRDYCEHGRLLEIMRLARFELEDLDTYRALWAELDNRK